MADIVPITNLRGPAARIVAIDADLIPWGEPISVIMTGPDQGRKFHFYIPLPLPGPETVNNDDATELLVLNPTKTSAALEGRFVSAVNPNGDPIPTGRTVVVVNADGDIEDIIYQEGP